MVAVSYAVDHDSLLVRAALGLMGSVPVQPGIVAFETSGVLDGGRERWEVVVQGRAELLDEDVANVVPPPLPLVRPDLTTALLVSMERVTGWIYGAAPDQL